MGAPSAKSPMEMEDGKETERERERERESIACSFKGVQ